MSTTTTRLAAISVQAFLEVKHALDECAPEIRDVVTEMMEVYASNDASPQEKRLALHTIIEALFPASSAEILQRERAVAQTATARQFATRMEEEEKVFASRVRQLMEEQEMTQQMLADKLGISQPAVANILNRQCRPQQRTVERIAEALGVTSAAIWPASNTSS